MGCVWRRNSVNCSKPGTGSTLDGWECERNRRIGKLQGNTNPFIEKQCR